MERFRAFRGCYFPHPLLDGIRKLQKIIRFSPDTWPWLVCLDLQGPQILNEEKTLKHTISAIGVMLSLLLGVSAFAQESAQQDIKDAGHETKQAAKDTG